MRRKSRQGKRREEGVTRRTSPLELKLKVLQELNDGAGVSDVCRTFGLAHTTVALWRQAYAKGGYEALFPGKARQDSQGEGEG
jgi:transposase-like protein